MVRRQSGLLRRTAVRLSLRRAFQTAARRSRLSDAGAPRTGGAGAAAAPYALAVGAAAAQVFYQPPTRRQIGSPVCESRVRSQAPPRKRAKRPPTPTSRPQLHAADHVPGAQPRNLNSLRRIERT